MEPIEPLQSGARGPAVIFAHANGYPPQTYRQFLQPFQDAFRVKAIYLRPFWPGSDPEALHNWKTFRDDYLGQLPSLVGGEGRVIGMGHSLGAMTTLMAAIEAPEKFRALVLIEPTMFPSWKGALMRLLAPFRLFRYLHPLIRRTLRRKTSFPDRESMFQNYRAKSIFSRIPDGVLWDYVGGLGEAEADGSLSLRYRPLWEVRIYETAGSADRYVLANLGQVPCPVLILRGELSDTIGPLVVERLAAGLPRGAAMNIPDLGHLLPLEAPGRIAWIILDFLDSALAD